jgi:TP901 family phage tail tape measure protein
MAVGDATDLGTAYANFKLRTAANFKKVVSKIRSSLSDLIPSPREAIGTWGKDLANRLITGEKSISNLKRAQIDLAGAFETGKDRIAEYQEASKKFSAYNKKVEKNQGRIAKVMALTKKRYNEVLPALAEKQKHLQKIKNKAKIFGKVQAAANKKVGEEEKKFAMASKAVKHYRGRLESVNKAIKTSLKRRAAFDKAGNTEKVKNYNAALRMFGGQLRKNRQGLREAIEARDEHRRKIEAAKKVEKGASEARKKYLSQGKARLAAIQEEQKRVSGLESVFRRMKNLRGIAAKQNKKNLDEVREARKRVKDQLHEMWSIVGRVVSQHLALAGVGLIAAGSAIALAAALGMLGANLEYSMAKVATMLGPSGLPALNDLQLDVVKASNKWGLSARDTANALYQILSAQISVANAGEVLNVSLRAAAAGFTTAERAADAITTMINAYSLSGKDAAEVSDMLFTTVRKGKTTFNELASQIGRVAGQLNISNVEMHEGLGAVAAMTQAGIKSSVAMTSLTAILRNLLSPSAEASAMAFEEFGITLGAAGLKARGLKGIFGALQGATSEQIRTIFASQRAFRGASAIIANYNKAVIAMKANEESAGATAWAASQVRKTATMQLDRLVQASLNYVKVLGQAIGYTDHLRVLFEGLSDIISRQAEKLEEYKSSWISVSLSAAITVTVLGGLALATFEFVRALGFLITLLPTVTTFLQYYRNALVTTAGASSLVSMASVGLVAKLKAVGIALIKLLTGPLGIFLVIAGAVYLAIKYLAKQAKNTKGVVEDVDSGWEDYAETMGKVADNASRAADSIQGLFDKVSRFEKGTNEWREATVDLLEKLHELGYTDVTLEDLRGPEGEKIAWTKSHEERLKSLRAEYDKLAGKKKDVLAQIHAQARRVKKLKDLEEIKEIIEAAKSERPDDLYINTNIREDITEQRKVAEEQFKGLMKKDRSLYKQMVAAEKSIADAEAETFDQRRDASKERHSAAKSYNKLLAGLLMKEDTARGQIQGMSRIYKRRANLHKFIGSLWEKNLERQTRGVGLASEQTILKKKEANLIADHLSTRTKLLDNIKKYAGKDEDIVNALIRQLKYLDKMFEKDKDRLGTLAEIEAKMKRIASVREQMSTGSDIYDIQEKRIDLMEKQGKITEEQAKKQKAVIDFYREVASIRSAILRTQEQIEEANKSEESKARDDRIKLLKEQKAVQKKFLEERKKAGVILDDENKKQQKQNDILKERLGFAKRLTTSAGITSIASAVSFEMADREKTEKDIEENTSITNDKLETINGTLKKIHNDLSGLSPSTYK